MSLAEALEQGAIHLGLSLPGADHDRLLALIESLGRWNKVYNLTRITDPAGQVTSHLLDSLAATRFLRGPRILDVGTGGGFPGLPLAIACPDLAFTLLDSNERKLRFVRQMVIELQIGNVEVVHARVEDYHPDHGFDTVLARALARLPEILALCRPLLSRTGQVLALKGARVDEELADIDDGWRLTARVPIEIPGLDAQRYLVILEPQAT